MYKFKLLRMKLNNDRIKFINSFVEFLKYQFDRSRFLTW
jgi:hypothetical protein